MLADVVQVERVPVDSNFFDDLGADSMVMAQFCARVRKRPDLPAVSIKDIYQHPTIRSLATALDGRRARVLSSRRTRRRSRRQSQPVLQSTSFAGAAAAYASSDILYVAALVAIRGFEWITAGSGVVDDLPAVSPVSAPRGFVLPCPASRSWLSGY